MIRKPSEAYNDYFFLFTVASKNNENTVTMASRPLEGETALVLASKQITIWEFISAAKFQWNIFWFNWQVMLLTFLCVRSFSKCFFSGFQRESSFSIYKCPLRSFSSSSQTKRNKVVPSTSCPLSYFAGKEKY